MQVGTRVITAGWVLHENDIMALETRLGEKCKKKMSHCWPQCTKWFSRYPIPKSGIWAKWRSPSCWFSASFSRKYVDITDAIWQDNEIMKVQYLSSVLFDFFEILQAVRTWQRNFVWFKISLLWQPKSKWFYVIEKTKGLLFKQKCFSKHNLKQLQFNPYCR